MAITEALPQLERQLGELVTRYEQYFIGLEKREPLQLLGTVEKLVRLHSTTPITNTMYKHKYHMLVARFSTYREHWNRVLRLIDEGKYHRDRFISDLHRRQRDTGGKTKRESADPSRDNELERIYNEYRQARQSCNLPVDNLSREMVVKTIEKSKPLLAARLGSDDLTFRVVVENGKPKIKARLRDK